MRVLAIDPGVTNCAYCLWEDGALKAWAVINASGGANGTTAELAGVLTRILKALPAGPFDAVVIETQMTKRMCSIAWGLWGAFHGSAKMVRANHKYKRGGSGPENYSKRKAAAVEDARAAVAGSGWEGTLVGKCDDLADAYWLARSYLEGKGVTF